MTQVFQISPEDFTNSVYNEKDLNLIPSFQVNTTFEKKSYIEYFVYDLNKNILFQDNNFTSYIVQNDPFSSLSNEVSQIKINSEENLLNVGFSQGEYNVLYNFLKYQIGNSTDKLFISEISSDRTEIRLVSNTITLDDLKTQTNNFIKYREESNFFIDFYLNFGENNLIISNNIALDILDPQNPSILIKLYEPLPTDFDLKDELWVVTKIEDSLAYNIEFEDEVIDIVDSTPLQGPNFNLDIKDKTNNSTPLLSTSDIISSNLSSSNSQLNNLLVSKDININVDYTDFNNFIHFSSAKVRLENFYYKIELLEEYSSSINIIQTQITGSTSESINILNNISKFENKIDDIITGFDKYEYYLYFKSSSYAWPKTNSQPPYQLAQTTDPLVSTWFGSLDEDSPFYGGMILSASLYDQNNQDYLINTIPEYLKNDIDNKPYELFVNMLGQHYDNIWIYTKDISNKFNADNRLEFGISKDLVADAIKEFGLNIYQNNFSVDDLYTAFLGITDDGALFPFPQTTGSLPTPTGFEYVDNLISASNDVIPLDDVNKSIYKRIYHNIPYLLKSKGTLKGVRSLITSYGIPDTILRINEFGGKDTINVDKWDYWRNEYNYAFNTEGSNSLVIPFELNPNWNSPNNRPSTITFRFKTNGLKPDNIIYSQSLFSTETNVALTLRYTGSAYISGSYSGSIPNPYKEYAHLDFYPDINDTTTTSSIYLPFYNGDWWSVMINKEGNNFTITAGNKIYEGGDNNTILGFYQSSSIISSTSQWDTSTQVSFPSQNTIGGNIYTTLSGSLQEIRYYNTILKEKSFQDYIKNPHSIEGNSLNSSPEELVFRSPLGGELYTGSISIHPKITGSWIPTESFNIDSKLTFKSQPKFIPNTEYIFLDQPNMGIQTHISDKIRLEENNIPLGDTLHPLKRLDQSIKTTKYTPDVNYLEITFSPQNEINDNINSQLGYFSLGEIIGDPSFRGSRLTSYPKLDKLRNEYFKKYIKNYNLVDFVRLIKFFDNSLFKLLKDFIPARTGLSSGITIKQHILERNRYPQPLMTQSYQEITGSISIGDIKGGTGGSFEKFNGTFTTPYGPNGNGPENIFDVTQSWVEINPTLSGSAPYIQKTQDEFYNGEFLGSQLTITKQNLNPGCDPFKQINPTPVAFFGVRFYNWLPEPANDWLPSNNSPTDGYVSIFIGSRATSVPISCQSVLDVIFNDINNLPTIEDKEQALTSIIEDGVKLPNPLNIYCCPKCEGAPIYAFGSSESLGNVGILVDTRNICCLDLIDYRK